MLEAAIVLLAHGLAWERTQYELPNATEVNTAWWSNSNPGEEPISIYVNFTAWSYKEIDGSMDDDIPWSEEFKPLSYTATPHAFSATRTLGAGKKITYYLRTDRQIGSEGWQWNGGGPMASRSRFWETNPAVYNEITDL